MERPGYKTWVRTRPIVILGALFLACLVLSALAFAWHWLFAVFLVPAAILGYIVLIVGLSRWRLSPSGGDYQDRVHQLLVSRVNGDRVLDIGCGSGHLLAEIARARPSTTLVGLDYWGDNWEYSRELCEANFRAEGLVGRGTFVRGTASNLPADLGLFDTVVSCMTFHEVRDVHDKTASLRQALSRVAPGGQFVFVDLFGDTSFYPDPADIDAAITESGGTIAERAPLSAFMPLPFPLKHKRVLGHAQLIEGDKPPAPEPRRRRSRPGWGPSSASSSRSG
jgi:SAM-dependent methyltransferase